MEKQRILIVHNYYQIPGGEDTVVANEKRMLEKHGHETFLYSRDNSELKSFTKLQKLGLCFSMIFNIRTYREVKKIIKEKKIDIVHVHNTLSLISPSVYYAALKCKVPVVQTVHNFRLLCPAAVFYRDGHVCEDCVQSGLRCAVKYNCYRNSKIQTLGLVFSIKIHRILGIYKKINYICLTEFNKRKLLQLKQIDSNRIFVKPNFADDISELVDEGERKNRFVFAGRLDKLKGIDILLQAWKLMKNEPQKLIICGTGPMEEWCKQYIAENKLVSIEMRGFVSNIEVRNLIANSKALILPTRWYEGFPMIIAEAFSVGTPVICSDLGNAGDLVTEGVTGCKFKDGSVKELIAGIVKIKTYDNIHDSTKTEYGNKYIESVNYVNLRKIYATIIRRKDINQCEV